MDRTESRDELGVALLVSTRWAATTHAKGKGSNDLLGGAVPVIQLIGVLPTVEVLEPHPRLNPRQQQHVIHSKQSAPRA